MGSLFTEKDDTYIGMTAVVSFNWTVTYVGNIGSVRKSVVRVSNSVGKVS